MIQAGLCGETLYSFLHDYGGWRYYMDQSAGRVYVLPADGFTNTICLHESQTSHEWKAVKPVQPVRIIHYTPEDVMAQGAQLFFMATPVARQIWHGRENTGAGTSFMDRLANRYKTGELPRAFTELHLARELIDAGLLQHLNADLGLAPVSLPKSPHAPVIENDIKWLKDRLLIE